MSWLCDKTGINYKVTYPFQRHFTPQPQISTSLDGQHRTQDCNIFKGASNCARMVFKKTDKLKKVIAGCGVCDTDLKERSLGLLRTNKRV